MVFKLLITYQILIINLSLTHILAKKRYPNWFTFSVLFLFTLILSTILYFASPLFSGERPTAWFVLTGSFYIAPLYYLYRIKFRELITIMVYCWTYTMFLSAFALGIANFIEIFTENIVFFSIQTFLFISTISWMIQFTKTKFIIILQNASSMTKDLLILLGFSLFGAITGTRYFVHPDETIYYLLLSLLIIIVITSYTLLYNNVQSNIHLKSARQIVYHDTLTGIGNRYSLFYDMSKYITDNKEFTILFLDLDGLKQINDTFGHKQGDEYLKHFAHTLIEQTKHNGSSYRFAGDEFICVIPKGIKPVDIKAFETVINREMNIHFEFGGVSIGASRFPEDGLDPDTLLQIADLNMYGAKRSKRIRATNLSRT